MMYRVSLPELEIETVAVHSGFDRDEFHGAMAPPISLASMYANKNGTQLGKYYYSRMSSPTRDAFENAITALEKGTHAVAFSSGTAAIVAVLSLLKRGDTVLKSDDLYAGSIISIETHAERVGAKVESFSDIPHLSELLAQGNVAMVWLETPSNPMLKVFDIQLVAELVHEVGAKLVVDNTFMSPALQRPLTLGADVSVNSVSKYIGGHSDVVMGVATTADEGLGSLLRTVQANDGAVPSPFDCFLGLRGIRTLPLRIGRQSENAMKVALALTQNEKVEIVRYPGLPKHPEHELMKVQADGFGAVISFTVTGGVDKALRMLKRCKLITPAVSLGGVETVVEHPASMTHRSIAKDERLAIGITDDLLRISVGIESAADIIADLEQALK